MNYEKQILKNQVTIMEALMMLITYSGKYAFMNTEIQEMQAHLAHRILESEEDA